MLSNTPIPKFFEFLFNELIFNKALETERLSILVFHLFLGASPVPKEEKNSNGVKDDKDDTNGDEAKSEGEETEEKKGENGDDNEEKIKKDENDTEKAEEKEKESEGEEEKEDVKMDDGNNFIRCLQVAFSGKGTKITHQTHI